MAQAFFGGVHPNDMKAATNEKAIEQLEAPAEVVIPMSMHIGAPCKPIVAVGDKVTIGQKIGEPGGFVSAPIHASVSGTVKAVEPRPFSMGGTMMSVVIENDFQNTVCPDIHPVEDPDSLTPEQQQIITEAAKEATVWQRAESVKLEKKAWDAFKAKGIEITMLTPEQRKELYDRTAPVREQFAKEIPAELLQLIADTQK